MDLFECYTLKDVIDNKIASQEASLKDIKKLLTIYGGKEAWFQNPNKESKRVPRQTAQIDEPPQGEKASLKSVMICGAEEARLVDEKEA